VGSAIVAAVVAPRLLSYEERLTAYRREHFAQDGYYNYYAANYHPAALFRYLGTELRSGENFLIVYAELDHFNLDFHARRAGLALSGVSDRAGPETEVTVYIAAPERVDYGELARRSHLSERALRAFTLLEDFGYYRLSKSPRRVPLRDLLPSSDQARDERVEHAQPATDSQARRESS